MASSFSSAAGIPHTRMASSPEAASVSSSRTSAVPNRARRAFRSRAHGLPAVQAAADRLLRGFAAERLADMAAESHVHIQQPAHGTGRLQLHGQLLQLRRRHTAHQDGLALCDFSSPPFLS